MTMEQVLGLYNYWIVICLMMTGFYMVIARTNMIKTVIGLSIFQTSVILMYITMGKVAGGTAPIIPHELAHHDNHDQHASAPADSHLTPAAEIHEEPHDDPHAESTPYDPTILETNELAHGEGEEQLYTNPLPSVLMLTAIVVGIATTAVALALVVRIREEYGTIDEDEIIERDREL